MTVQYADKEEEGEDVGAPTNTIVRTNVVE